MLGKLPYHTRLSDLTVPERMRIKTPFGQGLQTDKLNFVTEVFGGAGITPTTVNLLTGTPGAGKSTLMLQMADALQSRKDTVVLFNGGEESLYQTKMVCERLFGKNEPQFYIGEDSLVDSTNPALHTKVKQSILQKERKSFLGHARAIQKKHPDLNFVLMIDSIQMCDDGSRANGVTNTGTPERAMNLILNFCKKTFASAIVIGQVTKSGQAAGTNSMRHAIDSHLHLIIDTKDKSETAGMRILEMEKNRYGCSGKSFVCEMFPNGLRELGAL